MLNALKRKSGLISLWTANTSIKIYTPGFIMTRPKLEGWLGSMADKPERLRKPPLSHGPPPVTKRSKAATASCHCLLRNSLGLSHLPFAELKTHLLELF